MPIRISKGRFTKISTVRDTNGMIYKMINMELVPQFNYLNKKYWYAFNDNEIIISFPENKGKLIIIGFENLLQVNENGSLEEIIQPRADLLDEY